MQGHKVDGKCYESFGKSGRVRKIVKIGNMQFGFMAGEEHVRQMLFL